MSKPFLEPDDPILIKVAEPVDLAKIRGKEVQALIKKMFSAAFPEQGDASKSVLVGLAAPQIGISKRMILVDVAARGKGNVGDLRIYINPEIVWRSDKEEEWYEGCFSTSRVCGVVSRPNKIRIKAYTKEGQLLEEEYDGYTARIFQHEIDHLDGREFITHITDDNKLHWVEENEFPEYRNNEAWRNWTRKCPRKKWQKIKGIK